MKIAYTSMNVANIISILDFDSGEIRKIPTPKEAIADHRPFGITWNEDNLFIANPTKIIALDKAFNFKEVVVENLWYGIHQIAYKDGCLFMVSPRIDGIKRYNLKSKEMSYFLPKSPKWRLQLPSIFRNKDKNNFSTDVHHFNSILIKGDKVYLSAHNYIKPSFIAVFQYPDMQEMHKVEKTGTQMHGIAVDGDEIFWLDSCGQRSLKSSKGLNIVIGGEIDFVRGLSVTKEWIIVGYFPYDPYVRLQRKDGHSQIVGINRKTNAIERRFLIPNVGNINDIRVLDVFDYAHHIQPFTA